jgi:hypothetical protein
LWNRRESGLDGEVFEGLGGLGGAGEGVAAGDLDGGVSEDAGDGGQVVALFAEAGGQGVA